MRPPEVNLGLPYITYTQRGGRGRRGRGGGGGEREAWQVRIYAYKYMHIYIHVHHTHAYYRRTHLGTNIFKSLFRSQFDEIKCAQGGTVIAACSTLLGHILVAPSEGLRLPFTAADGITCTKE